MGKSSPAPPAPPDYAAISAAQGAANKDAAIGSAEISMVDQQTPWGGLTYEQTGTTDAGNPRYTATQTLSPAQQSILAGNEALDQQALDVANAQLGRVSTALAQPINFSGLPEQVTGVDPNTMDRARVEQALMDRMNPYLERDRAALQTSLANQGIAMGSEAWNQGMGDFARQSNDARLGAIAAAGQEQSRLFNMDAANAALQNAGRQQGIQELMLERQTPINEVSALTSGAQVAMPQFINTPAVNVAAPDIMGAAYASNNAQMQNYQAQLAANAARSQGLFSLLGAGLGAGAYSFGGGFGG